MAKFIMNQSLDLSISEIKKIDTETVNWKQKIEHCLYREIIFTNPKDCVRQKKVKNCEGLYEKEAFLVPFSNVRRQLLSMNRSSTQKKTLSMHLEFYTDDEIVKILSRMLPKHSSLRGLHLIFHDDIKFESWKKIGRLISRFSHITALSLNFRQKKPEMRDKDLASVQRSITMLTNLKYLGFAVTQNEQMLSQGYLRAGFIINTNHKTERFLYKLTSRLKKLEAVGLKVMQIDSLTDEGIRGFSRALSELPHVKDVSLILYDCPRVTNEGRAKFLDNLEKSPNLKKLKMVLTVSEICRESKILPLSHPIWASKNLEYVDLDIKFLSLFPVEVLDYTVIAIEKLRSLGKLTLNFHGVHYEIVGKITLLLLKCAELPLLTDLTVRFMNCLTLDYVTVNNIIYVVNSCPYLKKAEIEFLSCFKKTEGLTAEIKTPLVKRPNLKDLSLSFIDCTDLTEDQMDRIVELFTQCENLESLVLKIHWCKSFLDRHYQKFGKAISTMKFLEHITLGFEGCTNISINSSFTFTRMLPQLSLLKYFDINFSYFTDTANHELGPMAEWISQLKYLEGLKMAFKNCKKINDEGIKLFCSKLKGMRKLGTIMLVWSSGNIRELSKLLGNQLAMNLPNLYCIELHTARKNGHTTKVCIRLTA